MSALINHFEQKHIVLFGPIIHLQLNILILMIVMLDANIEVLGVTL